MEIRGKSDGLRVQQLIEEILDSGISDEEVCRDSPELLPQVREGWRKLQAIQAQIGALQPIAIETSNRRAKAASSVSE